LDRLTSGIIIEEIARGDFNIAYIQVAGSLVGSSFLLTPDPRSSRPGFEDLSW
jgi:cyclohexanecarboxyl-CoA dehydrogenase